MYVKEILEYEGPDVELKGNIWSLCQCCRCWIAVSSIKDPKDLPDARGFECTDSDELPLRCRGDATVTFMT